MLANGIPPFSNPIRVAASISDGKNNYLFPAEDIINGIGFERAKAHATGLAELDGGHFRVVSDEFDGRVNAIQKTQPQTGLLLLVPAGGFRRVEFSRRDFSDGVFHEAWRESVPSCLPRAQGFPGAPQFPGDGVPVPRGLRDESHRHPADRGFRFRARKTSWRSGGALRAAGSSKSLQFVPRSW